MSHDLGGAMVFERLDGQLTTDGPTGIARLHGLTDSAQLDDPSRAARHGSQLRTARLHGTTGSARLDGPTGSARLDNLTGSAQLDSLSRAALHGRQLRTARLHVTTSSARLDELTGSALLDGPSRAVRRERRFSGLASIRTT